MTRTRTYSVKLANPEECTRCPQGFVKGPSRWLATVTEGDVVTEKEFPSRFEANLWLRTQGGLV